MAIGGERGGAVAAGEAEAPDRVAKSRRNAEDGAALRDALN